MDIERGKKELAVVSKTGNVLNRIGGVMVSVLTKDYIIGICCFSSKHVALRSKSKDTLARNRDNVS